MVIKSTKITKIKIIYKKEMLDLFRDKKTLIMMVVIPLMLYPLIMMGSIVFGSAIADSVQSDEYHIAVMDDDADGSVNGYDGKELRRLLSDTGDELGYRLIIEDIPPDGCAQALAGEKLDAYIEVSSQNGNKDGRNVFTICYLSSKPASETASGMIGDKLEIYKKQTSRQIITALGIGDPDLLLEPVAVSFDDRSANEERVGRMLGMVLPMLMVTSILLGAFYPAVDTTAGEKERGTLETLLTLPVGNDELIIGKFLAVSTVAVASAVLNLVSMLFMSVYFYATIQTADAQALNVNLADFVPALVIVLLCMAAFAFFISAVTMCITTFARSFKEANNYATPVMLVVMLASFVTFIPDIEFTALLAAAPVVNICLLVSNILVFKYSFYIIMVVLVSNIAYAVLAILLLIRLYNSEELMFGEGGTNIQIFTGRKGLKSGGVPTLSDAVLVLAAVLLLMLYAGSLLQAKFLLWGVLATQLFIIGVPLAAAWYTKKDMRKTFSLKCPRPAWILGAILAETGCYLIELPLSAVLAKLFPQGIQAVNHTIGDMLKGTGIVPALLIMALAPAICEEALFRGYFFSAAKKRMGPAAVLAGGIVFGIYHLSLVRFFTTGLLGILFCYVVYKTGSIYLTSLMHFINNAAAVFVMFYPETAGKLVPILMKESLSVAEAAGLVLTGMVCLSAGLFMCRPVR